MAKLMYAHNLPAGGGPITARHAGAALMYYGGTVIGFALAIILMTQWHQLTGRELHAPRADQYPRPASDGSPQHACAAAFGAGAGG
jgi:hypothetical protein